MVILGWTLIVCDTGVFRRRHQLDTHRHTEGWPREDTAKDHIHKPGERPRKKPHLDLNFQPPELWENRFLGFTCPVCSICYGSLTRIIQALEVSPASLQVKETCWWMNTRQCPLVLCSGGKSAYNLLRIVAERVSEYIHELIHKLFPEFTKI